jgi:hypothetical protein
VITSLPQSPGHITPPNRHISSSTAEQLPPPLLLLLPPAAVGDTAVAASCSSSRPASLHAAVHQVTAVLQLLLTSTVQYSSSTSSTSESACVSRNLRGHIVRGTGDQEGFVTTMMTQRALVHGTFSLQYQTQCGLVGRLTIAHRAGAWCVWHQTRTGVAASTRTTPSTQRIQADTRPQ